MARLVPFYEFDERRFFCADDAPDEIAAHSPGGLHAAGRALPRRGSPRPRALTAETADGVSDLQFTSAYRVPFQFSRLVRQHLKAGAFVQSSAGVTVTDLDGNRFYDLTGSYGVNVFGYDFYKDCIAAGLRRRAARSARCSGPTIR